jgi:rhodanese-related sulfurtransferase
MLSQVQAAFPNRATPLVVGCKSGKRSTPAAAVLAAAGYTQVLDVGGGYDAWQGGSGEDDDEHSLG